MANPDIHPDKTCFLCVSPDYSSIVAQHLSHALSKDGEIYHIEAVNVPFPDESHESYLETFIDRFSEWTIDWDNFVLIEAGVIRGGNYNWITEAMSKYQILVIPPTILLLSVKTLEANSNQILFLIIMTIPRKIYTSGGSVLTTIGNAHK